MRWRDATRAAELAERLAEIAVAGRAGQADRGALASDQIALDGRDRLPSPRSALRGARDPGGAGRRARRREPQGNGWAARTRGVLTARASEAEAGAAVRDRNGLHILKGCLASTYHLVTRPADGIRAAIEAATGFYAAHPEQARWTDSEARASLVNGLVIVVEGPAGGALTTDMVRSVGGTGGPVTWLVAPGGRGKLRHHLDRDACRCPRITLETVEVTVDSESDDRGMLGMDDAVPSGPLSGRVRVRLIADGVDNATLEELAAGASIIAPCATRSSARSPSLSRLRRTSRHEVAQRCPPPIPSKTRRSSSFAVAVISFIAYEIGLDRSLVPGRTPACRRDRRRPRRSILALLAFLLAITMGMASDRFDTRRGLVLEEANAIQTTYLRAGYLPEPPSARSGT